MRIATIKVTAISKKHLNEITVNLFEKFGSALSPASVIKDNDKDDGCHCYFFIEEAS